MEARILHTLFTFSSKFVFSRSKFYKLVSIKSSDFPHDFNNSLTNVSFALCSSTVLTNTFFSSNSFHRKCLDSLVL